MIAFAWLLLLAAANRVELVDEVYQIPAGDWRYVDVSLKQRPAGVTVEFEVQPGGGHVKVALMRRQDEERLREDLPHGMLSAVGPASSGRLRFQVPTPGDYVVVVDNREEGSRAAAVHLHIALDFATRFGPGVTSLSPQRQLTVIVISFGVFFGIVIYSGRRLLRAIRR